MEVASLIIFLLVYSGMIFGCWPGFAIDRTGIALLGAIAFIEMQGITLAQASTYVDFSALAILFSFMIVSAQFYFCGFYTHVIESIGKLTLDPSKLLCVIIFISAFLSAILINDIVCLASTPLIIKVCFRKKLNPVPFLIGLACSANIGSALTLVGNPQNLLIGQVLNMSFAEYLKFSFIPCLLSLFSTWLIIVYQRKGDWFEEREEINPDTIPFDRFHFWKGIIVIVAILIIFFFTNLPRDKVSLVGAGVLLLSRRMASYKLMSFIDWRLLVLFSGLFIVNRSFLHINDVSFIPKFLESYHVDLTSPMAIIFISLILSNIVSNVPAVMLLLPFINTFFEGSVLAISSTFAGNLFVVGSIANLIVITHAAEFNVKINWKQYVKIGFPVTAASYIILMAWIYLIQM